MTMTHFDLKQTAGRYLKAEYDFRTCDLDTADAAAICGECTLALHALVGDPKSLAQAIAAQAAELDALRRQNAELIEERDCYLGNMTLMRNQQADTPSDPAGRAVALAQAELRRAQSLYPAMHSAHEGYAVLLEEVDELWAEIKRYPRERSALALHAEAVQVAAVALRMIAEVTLPGLRGQP